MTRRRIIEKAGHRFKQDGIDGSGISTLMADAELTNGAFYAHFASKDDLVAHVVAEELHTQVARYGTLRPGRPGLEDLLQTNEAVSGQGLAPAERPAADTRPLRALRRRTSETASLPELVGSHLCVV
ncbi:TetR/AcrR family transcriptional regulator [Streptomyces canus]|uniref:TetR/AcrR family transcriptional regulator n=1 Tax=Streptomyces canus TaxID=58343 RepID=UPI003F4B5923